MIAFGATERLSRALRAGALIVAAVATVIPVLWMMVGWLKTETQLFSNPLALPDSPAWANYGSLFQQFHFGLATLNSVEISLGVVAISVVLGSMAAYGFSRYPFTGSLMRLTAFLITLMFTPAALVVPLYLIMNALVLLRNVLSIILV